MKIQSGFVSKLYAAWIWLSGILSDDIDVHDSKGCWANVRISNNLSTTIKTTILNMMTQILMYLLELLFLCQLQTFNKKTMS